MLLILQSRNVSARWGRRTCGVGICKPYIAYSDQASICFSRKLCSLRLRFSKWKLTNRSPCWCPCWFPRADRCHDHLLNHFRYLWLIHVVSEFAEHYSDKKFDFSICAVHGFVNIFDFVRLNINWLVAQCFIFSFWVQLSIIGNASAAWMYKLWLGIGKKCLVVNAFCS